MAIKIRKNIVSPSVASSVTYAGTNGKTHIVVHETDNTNKGADADAHGRLQANGNSRSASWHYSVDDKEAVQSFSDNAQCWAAGNAHYNRNGIQVEICVNSDGDYVKAVENGAELVAILMKRHGIPLKNVIQHNYASGKHCPRKMREGYRGVNWTKFKRLVSAGGGTVETSAKAPKSPSKTTSTASKGGKYTGSSIVMYLQSIGQPSSLAARKKLASKHGVKNYTGTAKQNTELLHIMRDGKSAPKAKTKTKAKANLTVDGKWGKTTTKALQRALGTKADGIISRQPNNSVARSLYGGTVSFGGGKGSPMVKALQRKVGARADGKLGPATVRSLQKYLGTKQDGVLSRPSVVVREMQRRLNAGTF